MKKTLFYCLIILFFSSCRKEPHGNITSIQTEKLESKVIFAKLLAKSIEEEPAIREFIRTEALKQFDKDNDVLFQMVMDHRLSSGKTFYETILKYASSKDEIDKILQEMPTLTIMVPELPNFSAATWKADSQIPIVAVSPEKRRTTVHAYNAAGEITEIPFGRIPGYPIVVVKENERVDVSTNGQNKSPKSSILLKASNAELSNKAFLIKGNNAFSFSNEAFNGLQQTTVSEKKRELLKENTIARVIPVGQATDPNYSGFVVPAVLNAYNIGAEWHRDYIYYGIDISTGTTRGKFNNSYAEHIVTMKMSDDNISRISDQGNDPTPTQAGHERGFPTPAEWTDGYFDIRISILINSQNGAGAQLNKVISASASDLYDIKYTYSNRYYTYAGVTAKEFLLDEPIVPWNLQNYGSAWKFIVSEYDPSEEVTSTVTNTTTYSTNFEFDASFGEVVKVGPKFGSTSTNVSGSTYQYKTTTTSDDLGEGILEFSSPIILRREQVDIGTPSRPQIVDQYVTYEVTTGSVNLSVEPRTIR